jgi:hypothetical protein
MPNPYYENEHGALYQGDALAVLRELPDCLSADMIQFLTPIIKRIALGDVFIGEGFVGYAPDGSVRIREISVARNFRFVPPAIRLKTAKVENNSGRFRLDSQIWENKIEYCLSLPIRCLKAIQRTPIVATWFFSVIPSSKRFGNEFDCGFINHADLNSSVITGCLALLAFISFILLNANVALPVNKPRDIGYVGVLHNNTTP